MLVYKIVLQVDNKFFSPVMRGKARLEYVIGKPVEVPEWLRDANLYPFVFHDLKFALLFKKRGLLLGLTREVILECQASNQVPLPIPHLWWHLEYGSLERRTYISPEAYFGTDTFSYKTIIPQRRI
jgi:hypothetical protein